jgi:putative Ca2+/H+ antiporter (TMEM165/GDT1 family)
MSSLFLFATALTAAAEIGDKSQLMSLLLGMRFRRPAVVILGIFVASVANHTLAALTGRWVGSAIDPQLLRWSIALVFFALALWTALPDDWSTDGMLTIGRGGILAPAISFFLSELGDKSEIGIISLAADYHSMVPVAVGGIAGMMIANVPVVLFGTYAARWIAQPGRILRYAAAGCFAIVGLLTALGIRIG